MFYELKRVALGEFLDDLDISNKSMEYLGFETEEGSSSEEKLGEERLGPTNSVTSMGSTFLLGSVVLTFIVLIIVICVVISRAMSSSEKCRMRVEKLKLKVFHNPIIRYLILNSIKLNTAAILSLKAAIIEDLKQMPVPITLMAVITLTPVVLSVVAYRRRKSLGEDKVRRSIGSIYEGKNVERDDHKVYLFPLLFFWRRTCFVIVTVFLFAHPALQMAAHYVLTMLSATMLLADGRAFESKAQRNVEVGSEFLLLFSSISLSQYANMAYSKQQKEVM